MYDKERGLYIAHCSDGALSIVGKMANRHGLIAGATGTGKTVTLQVMAESFCQAGVPCFMADMKGDLSGISQVGKMSGFIEKRLPEFGIEAPEFQSCPVRFFDVFGEQGHPMRATVSQMGPQLLSRLLNLNETQDGVLNITFRIADERGLLILDLKDLRSMLDYVSKHSKEYTTKYGNISSQTVGAIQRSLLQLEAQGAEKFFGEPSFDIFDLMQSEQGKGIMNVLAADKLMMQPKLYSTFLLWLLSELYSKLPEVGDMELPKLVFFFDEAHMLFDGTSKALLDKIEQVIRLIRSKGVGIYFITQNPTDIPDSILGQLGNRVQHALRAYTPKDQKAVKAAADTFRANPDFKTDEAIMELETGEALVSFLDEKGAPSVVQRAKILFPLSQIGAVTEGQRLDIIKQSRIYGKYDEMVDRESAYEQLVRETQEEESASDEAASGGSPTGKGSKEKKKPGILSKVWKAVLTAITGTFATILGTWVSDKVTGKKTRSNTSATGRVVKNATSAATRAATRELTRDILGNLKTVIPLMFIGAMGVMGQTPTNSRTVTLKVIETSDVHGHFFPYDFIEGHEISGTLSRANTYIERQRQQYGDRLLLIDNGDILQGQPCTYWSNYVMPEDENLGASVVNYMRYDAETVGNHDVETGHAVYDKWLREVHCPLLGANIVDRENQLPYVHPYAIIERQVGDAQNPQTVKIAILGMVTPVIPIWLNESLWQGLEFQEMVSCARKWVRYIQQVEHPDLILGLFHSGLSGGITMENGNEENATRRVAQEVEGFDAIFFGHDHQVHNITLQSPSGRNVLCIDPSCYVKNVAEATITLTYNGQELVGKDITGEIINVSNEEVDSRMVAHFQQQIDAIKTYVGRRIGTFKTAASTRDSYFGNSTFIDFIHQLQLQITGADISLNAPLSFDAKIDAGTVTVADMFKLYRFENKLYVMRMTGREILGHLEMSYDQWVNTMTSPSDHLLLLREYTSGNRQRMGFKNYSFNFDSASGIDYEVDVTKPDGEKVHILRMSNGEPFDENRVYKVVMNSYRANGGGDLMVRGAGIPKDSLNGRIVYQSELDLRHYLMEEIERQGTVTPRAAHNWKFVPERWVRAAARRDRRLLFDN